MRIPQSRISVFDLMIMIAVAAPGIALARGLPYYVTIERTTMVINQLSKTANSSGQSGMGWGFGGIGMGVRSAGTPFERRPSYWFVHVPVWSAPSLLLCSVAATILGLRGRRPGLRHFGGRPGIAAGLAVLFALAAIAVDSLRVAWVRRVAFGSWRNGWSFFLADLLDFLVRPAGLCVAAWWLALALSGRWKPETNAGGRLGRVLGWSWIAMAVFRELGEWCFALNC